MDQFFILTNYAIAGQLLSGVTFVSHRDIFRRTQQQVLQSKIQGYVWGESLMKSGLVVATSAIFSSMVALPVSPTLDIIFHMWIKQVNSNPRFLEFRLFGLSNHTYQIKSWIELVTLRVALRVSYVMGKCQVRKRFFFSFHFFFLWS